MVVIQRVGVSRGARVLLATAWLMFLLVAPARAGEGTPGDEPPPPVEQPTDVPPPPPTDIPPPPTDVPPSPPTEIPPAPTEVPPTDVPPTDVPPTDVPTEEPTAEPTEEPSPTPTPTPEPAIAFDPVLDCHLIDGGELAVAGETTWSYQDCTVTWQTENVSQVVLEAWTEAGGWQVIAVDLTDLDNPDALAIADGTLDLTDTNLDDDGFLSSRFLVGTQLGCTSAASALTNLHLTATSTAPVPEDEQGNPIQIEDEAGELVPVPPGEQVTETTVSQLGVDSQPQTDPEVSITGFSFQAIDIREQQQSIGTLTVAYSEAPSACGWQIGIQFADFTSSLMVVPVSDLSLLGVAGLPDSASTSLVDGQLSIIVPADPAAATSGTLSITTTIVFPAEVPPGGYQTSVTIQAMRLQ